MLEVDLLREECLFSYSYKITLWVIGSLRLKGRENMSFMARIHEFSCLWIHPAGSQETLRVKGIISILRLFYEVGQKVWVLRCYGKTQTDFLANSKSEALFHVRAFTCLSWNIRSQNNQKKSKQNRSLGQMVGTENQFSSVQFSHSVVSNSLQPHGLQHSRLPCPSPTPRAYSNSCSLSQWCHPTI